MLFAGLTKNHEEHNTIICLLRPFAGTWAATISVVPPMGIMSNLWMNHKATNPTHAKRTTPKWPIQTNFRAMSHPDRDHWDEYPSSWRYHGCGSSPTLLLIHTQLPTWKKFQVLHSTHLLKCPTSFYDACSWSKEMLFHLNSNINLIRPELLDLSTQGPNSWWRILIVARRSKTPRY